MLADRETLVEFPLILMASSAAKRALASIQEGLTPAFEVRQASTALAMVRREMGLTLLASSVVPNFDADDLVCRTLEGAQTVRSLGTVRRAALDLSTPARLFIEQLKAQNKSGSLDNSVGPTLTLDRKRD